MPVRFAPRAVLDRAHQVAVLSRREREPRQFDGRLAAVSERDVGSPALQQRTDQPLIVRTVLCQQVATVQCWQPKSHIVIGTTLPTVAGRKPFQLNAGFARWSIICSDFNGCAQGCSLAPDRKHGPLIMGCSHVATNLAKVERGNGTTTQPAAKDIVLDPSPDYAIRNSNRSGSHKFVQRGYRRAAGHG